MERGGRGRGTRREAIGRRPFVLICALLPDIRLADLSFLTPAGPILLPAPSAFPLSPPHLSYDWRPLPLSHLPLDRLQLLLLPSSDQNSHSDCSELFQQLGYGEWGSWH